MKQAFRSYTPPGFGGPDHEDITIEALRELYPTNRQLGLAAEDSDVLLSARKDDPTYHCDRCMLEETFANINAWTALAVQANNPDPNAPNGWNPDAAMKYFGWVLHATQDFYAHSNWVEGGQTELVSSDGLSFPAGRAGDLLGDQEMVVYRDVMPATSQGSVWTQVSPNFVRVPLLGRPDGTIRGGLITGKGAPGDCPAMASIPHGPTQVGGLGEDEYLAKDDPVSFHFEEAVAFAVRQTKEEFCRLDRLTWLRWGEYGHLKLYNWWTVALNSEPCPQNKALEAGIIMATMVR